jgi:DNA-binding transcriptional LysR family regulator
MELRQLRYLVLLAEELSFTRAAARGHVAQPALSRQIRRLEDEFGTPLVDRTSRRVRMTAAGEALVEHAVRALHELDEARSELLDASEVVGGGLRLGVTATPGPVPIADVLSVFHERYPNVDLHVREGLSVDLADRLRADGVDLAIISRLPDVARQRLAMELIAAEDLVVILAPDHPLAQRGPIELPALGNESLVLFPAPATIRRAIDDLFSHHELAPRVAVETRDTNRVRELVAKGLGVGFLPRSDATRPGPAVAMRGIRTYPLRYELFTARRARRRAAPGVRAMEGVIRELLSEP